MAKTEKVKKPTKIIALNPNIKEKLSTSYFKKQETTSSRGQLIQCFLNTDMRNNHEGLKIIAGYRNIDVTQLLPGQYVVFLNSKKDYIKIYTAFGVVGSKKLEKGRVYDLRVIAEIPKAFNGTSNFNMDAALEKALLEALARKSRTKLQTKIERAAAVTSAS